MAEEQRENVTVVTDEQNGGEVTVCSGDTLAVRLRANITTGFSWHLLIDRHDPFQNVGSDYHPTPVPEGVSGSGGVQEFRIVVMPPKSYPNNPEELPSAGLRMLYIQSWDPTLGGENRTEFRLTVKIRRAAENRPAASPT